MPVRVLISSGSANRGHGSVISWFRKNGVSSRRLLQFKVVAGFSTLQVAVQFLAALSGLLLVNVLDKPQFAAYAIAASLLVTFNVLTDCGIGTGLNALGGRVWRDRAALGSLVVTALRFRGQLACFAMPLGFGFGLFLFRQNALAWFGSVMLTLVALSGIWGMVTTNTYAVALRLAGKYLEVQRLELIAALVRLALLGAMALLFIDALIAILAVTVSVTVQALWIRRKASAILDTQALPDPSEHLEMGRFVRLQWFPTWFFAFQGQITIWLMAVFGSSEQVAEVGALGRLAVIFSFITSLLNGIATPTLARCDSQTRLHRLFGAMLVGYGLFGGTLLATGFAFPREILSILGGQYAGLAREVPLVMETSVLWGLTGVFYAVASARGWIWQAWIWPLATVALQVMLLRWLDLTQVRGVLVFGLLSTLPVLFSVAYMVGRGLATSRSRVAAAGH